MFPEMTLLFLLRDERQKVKRIPEGHVVVRWQHVVQTGVCRSLWRLCSQASPEPHSRTRVLKKEFTMSALVHLYFGQDLILTMKKKCFIQ